jgi:hypothetical protein
MKLHGKDTIHLKKVGNIGSNRLLGENKKGKFGNHLLNSA